MPQKPLIPVDYDRRLAALVRFVEGGAHRHVEVVGNASAETGTHWLFRGKTAGPGVAGAVLSRDCCANWGLWFARTKAELVKEWASLVRRAKRAGDL
ncbi:MAG: hypothetical protein WC718_12850 [Phycisphaerales bacterium]|jgi:hypothetical protein